MLRTLDDVIKLKSDIKTIGATKGETGFGA